VEASTGHDAVTPSDAHVADHEAADAPVDAATKANRGPATFVLPDNGNPNGLYWDDPSQTLYIADNENNRILKYTDTGGIVKVVDLPAVASNGPGLGQLVLRSDGSIVVTRFGFGTEGSIVVVAPDLTATVVPNLDVTRERIGLTVAPDGTVFDTYFIEGAAGYVGAIAQVDLTAGTETDVITGLTKPVGVIVVGPTLYADDQQGDELYSAPLATPSSDKVFVALPDADLLCVGPNGSLFSGGSDGNVRQISSSGTVAVFAGGFEAARGVAYDPTNARLFVANHGADNALDIRPVP
jgi:sugar lactone lactonase YvrE